MGTNKQLGLGSEDDAWVPTEVTGKQLENRYISLHAVSLLTSYLIMSKILENKRFSLYNAGINMKAMKTVC